MSVERLLLTLVLGAIVHIVLNLKPESRLSRGVNKFGDLAKGALILFPIYGATGYIVKYFGMVVS